MTNLSRLSEAQKIADILLGLGNDDHTAYQLIHGLGETGGYPDADKSINRFLSSKDPALREITLNVLLLHWGLDEYLPICRVMAESDPDEDVREMAISCLGSLLQGTKSPADLKLLGQITRSETFSRFEREAAYSAFLAIFGTPSNSLPSAAEGIDFENDVDWSLVDQWSR